MSSANRDDNLKQPIQIAISERLEHALNGW